MSKKRGGRRDTEHREAEGFGKGRDARPFFVLSEHTKSEREES